MLYDKLYVEKRTYKLSKFSCFLSVAGIKMDYLGVRATTTSAPVNPTLFCALLYRVGKAISFHLNVGLLNLNIVS